MKKNYFMLAATAALFAACAETDLVNEIAVEETPQAIGFDAYANKTTRAEITETDDLKDENGGFHVWGYKSTDAWSTSYTVFNNIPVSWNTNLSPAAWDYENTQYWDKNAIYKFYAVAPKAGSSSYSIDEGRTNANNKYMITITSANNSTDYLIDRDGVTNTQLDANRNILTGVAGFPNGTVDFNFNHIMSKISFKLKAGVEEEIIVTSLTMSGWNNNAGNFTQIPNYDTSNRNNTEWSMEEGTSGSFTIINNSSHADGLTLPSSQDAVPVLADEDNLNSFISLITVPQNIAANTLTFTISYKIVKNNSDDEVYTDQVGKISTAQSWYTDTHTTYTISVTPDAIEFGNPTIQSWTYSTTPEEDLPL